MLKVYLLPILAAGFWLIGSFALAQEASEQDLRFFESHVRPLLAEHCYECHAADQQEAQLRLDTYSGMLAGGVSGPSVVPGDAQESLILSAVNFQDEALQMPPDGKLSDQQIAVLTQWIAAGAPHPDGAGSVPVVPRRGAIDLDEAKKYWAFQPVVRPEIPQLDSRWIENPLDAFILAGLQSQGLTAAPPADKRTLIRRATFDLTGLPPTADEVTAFLADPSPDAFARVIDRLLSSEQYGQRWGRHWLDVARYADSNGLDENVAHGNAWRYRDYVVDAFNDDKPFDRFVLEQIAGDLLVAQAMAASEPPPDTVAEHPTPPSAATANDFERLIATGFLVLGPKVLAEGDQEKLQMDVIDEQIDTLGRALLGMTLGCARCHDHKFDPISMDDYYALAGIFKSTRTMESLKRIAKWNENIIATAEHLEEKRQHDEKIAAKQAEIESFLSSATAATEAASKLKEEELPAELKDQLKQHRDVLSRLQQTAAELPAAMGVRDGEVADTRIHVRGSHLTLGRKVARTLPAVVAPQQPEAIGETESGRLQLARWLASAENPLTARVMVNRLWRWHFGQGLVSTTDNFGMLGERPTNQPLLDWLAAEFVATGWSIKAMQRRIMLSSTYQLSSQSVPQSAAIDPDNRYRWRADVRRLEAEAVRDAMLSVSGLLDHDMGGSLLHVANRAFLFDHTSKDTTSYDSHRRSLYLPVIRNNLYDGFSLFDYTTADVPNGDRETSTVATQALFLMNSDLLSKTSSALARRLLAEHPDDQHARVERLYELSFSRTPTRPETQRLLDFVKRFERLRQDADGADAAHHTAWIAACQTILATNEFIYVR